MEVSKACAQSIIAEDTVDFFARFDGNIENLIKNTNTECFQIKAKSLQVYAVR